MNVKFSRAGLVGMCPPDDVGTFIPGHRPEKPDANGRIPGMTYLYAETVRDAAGNELRLIFMSWDDAKALLKSHAHHAQVWKARNPDVMQVAIDQGHIPRANPQEPLETYDPNRIFV